MRGPGCASRSTLRMWLELVECVGGTGDLRSVDVSNGRCEDGEYEPLGGSLPLDPLHDAKKSGAFDADPIAGGRWPGNVGIWHVDAPFRQLGLASGHDKSDLSSTAGLRRAELDRRIVP